MNIKRILREEIYKQTNIDSIINRTLYEGLSRLVLNESQESKSQSKAIKLAMQNGMNRERAEQFVRVDLRNDLSELRHSDTAKFTLGCTRLYFERQLTDAKSISLLNQILGLITKKYYDKFDQNLNGIGMKELSEKFSQELNDIEVQNRDEVNNKEYANQGYKIVPIGTFEEAGEYYKYMYSKSPWCITYMDNMWENYTKNGENKVYFCLKNGFEHMEAPKETGNFKDEYGLSMISVIVDEDGKLVYSTTRWNHANGASGDHDLTVQEISNIVGVNFYQTFKPNISFNDKVKEVLQRLKAGEKPEDVFDKIYGIQDGFMLVKLNNKYNYIDTNGSLLSDQWFYYASNFEDGIAKVKLNEKYNLIDTNGDLLSNQWFDYIYDFYNGFAKVKLNNKYNLIDANFKTLSEQWFDDIYDFKDGFAKVKLNNKYNLIDANGDLLSNQWFDYIYDFKDGFAIVKLNNKQNLIDIEGNIISKQWFDLITEFVNGMAFVIINKKWNLIDKEGNIKNKQWEDVKYK